MNRCTIKPDVPIAIGRTESVAKATCRCSAADRSKCGDKKNEAYDPAQPKYTQYDNQSIYFVFGGEK